jgi:sugar phosphate isomerase/epimerase
MKLVVEGKINMFIDSSVRFGMVQGRLIQSPPDQLQWFPQEYWESEFFLASALGIDYIELIAERIYNPDNPLWTDDGLSQIKKLNELNGLSLHAFCNDYVIDNKLSDEKVMEQNFRLLERGSLLGCEKYILPLFESSELTINNVNEYIEPLRKIADKAHYYEIKVCLETVLNGSELIEVLDLIDHPAVTVVFDTGNRIAFGHDLANDIRLLGKRISHVHIKDKNKENENVILGTGLVNFKDVFEALASIEYEGPYTFETQRGKNPTRTATYNMELVNYFYSEGFS